MNSPTPSQTWWTAEEIAAAALPDLPATRQGVEAVIKRCDWRGNPDLARRRAGKGGGWEYSWRLFPSHAQRKLLASAAAPVAKPAFDRDTAWAWFDSLPEDVRAKARAHLAILDRVEALEHLPGMGRHNAICAVAREAKIGPRTIWSWFVLVEGVGPDDRLCALAPKHRAAAPKAKRVHASAEFLDRLKADYLRLAGPTFQSAYDRAAELCRHKGWAVFTDRTARRWMDENVPRVTQVYAREGEAGLARCFPPQIRDRSGLVSLEAVNADCHKIDVFVQWPGIDKPVRPQIVAFQDLFSNKMLAWRIDLDPNKVAVMSAFGEMVETWGIPRHCLFDNGREFANKWLTGGTPTRFRFKVRADDPLGVLPMMGVKIHWATPAHGQAKPIERGFRDFADRIAKHPAFAGAYVGNRPDAKPEDYGSRAIPLEEFKVILAEGIRAHNARPGRGTDNAKGRSFDETFAASYATDRISKATEAQRRLWLMGQEVRKLHKSHGALWLHGNRYWADWMNELAGDTVVARFDPEDLHAGLSIYALGGAFLGEAECLEKVGFFDLVGAKTHSRQVAQQRKAEKKLLDTMRAIPVAAYAAELAAIPREEVEDLSAKVVTPIFGRPSERRAVDAAPSADVVAAQAILISDLAARRSAVAAVEETARDRFKRALTLMWELEGGDEVASDDQQWLKIYQTSSEYRAERLLWDDFGETTFG